MCIRDRHPSWHPKQLERTKKGGDLWLYGCKFGKCIAGSHPDIVERTVKRSSHYFTVNFAYTVTAQPANHVSHELEYCPKRVVPYVHKDGFCEESQLGQSVCNYSRSVETEVLENASLTVDLPDSEEAASNSSDSSSSSTLVSNVDAQEQCHATKTSVIQSEEPVSYTHLTLPTKA